MRNEKKREGGLLRGLPLIYLVIRSRRLGCRSDQLAQTTYAVPVLLPFQLILQLLGV